MGTVGEGIVAIVAGEAQPGLMHQRGGLQGVGGRFRPHFLGGQLAQLIIHQRQQFLCRHRVALLCALQNAGDFFFAQRAQSLLQRHFADNQTTRLTALHHKSLIMRRVGEGIEPMCDLWLTQGGIKLTIRFSRLFLAYWSKNQYIDIYASGSDSATR